MTISLSRVSFLTFAFTVGINAISAAAPVFTKDVAPIFMESCVECHRSGEIGPMSLRTYEEVRPWAKSIAKVVANRIMPPWHANPEIGEWSNDISLSQEKIDTIVSWVDAGAKKGNPKDMPAMPKFKDEWSFGKPDYIVEFPPLEVPSGQDVYFDPKVEVNFPKNTWLRAVDIRPGNRAVAHHINILAGDRPTMAATKERDVNESAKINNHLQGGGILGDAWLGSWGPGAGASRPFPDGMGRPIPDVKVITGDIHTYNATDKTQIERTKVGFYYGKGDLKKVMSLGAAGSLDLAIPPGERKYESMGTYTFDQDVNVVSFTPHMHLIGRDMTFTAVYADDRREVLLEVPRYKFNWQTVYSPAEHKFMPKGSKIEVVSHLDNSADNPYANDPSEWVLYGAASYEEMAFGIFSFYPTEGTKVKTGSMQKRVDEFLKTAPEGAYSGKVRLAHVPMKIPMAVVVPEEGNVLLCIGNGGMTVELDAGEVQWDGNKFSANRNSGQGPVEVNGTLIDGFVDMTIRLDDADIPIMNTKDMDPWKFEMRKPRG